MLSVGGKVMTGAFGTQVSPPPQTLPSTCWSSVTWIGPASASASETVVVPVVAMDEMQPSSSGGSNTRGRLKEISRLASGQS